MGEDNVKAAREINEMAGMEVVQFVSQVNGNTRTFTWQAPAHALKPFSLSDIAPSDFAAQPITVYVAPSRLSR